MRERERGKKNRLRHIYSSAICDLHKFAFHPCWCAPLKFQFKYESHLSSIHSNTHFIGISIRFGSFFTCTHTQCVHTQTLTQFSSILCARFSGFQEGKTQRHYVQSCWISIFSSKRNLSTKYDYVHFESVAIQLYTFGLMSFNPKNLKAQII